jgi:hypothetical protein
MAKTGIERARRLLAPPQPTDNPWSALGAAALAASAAILMAGVMVLGPGIRFEETSAAQPMSPTR